MTATTLELLQKYSVPGPRYTSYPTAPYFSKAFGEADWLDALNAPAADRGLSLYAHIPFCDSLCYYCGCNMVATRDYRKTQPYLAALDREMARTAEHVDPARLVHQLHWGGGTPTYLNPDDIRRLMAMMRTHFKVADDAEISCEADPRELTRAHLEALRESGFNRISFGVQDMDPAVQQAVNRIQPEALIQQVIDWSRELGFASINLDLIVGLPKQTVSSFRRTLERVTQWSPDRLAVFSYAHVPWLKKHQNLIREAELPDAATRLDLQQAVNEILGTAGYVNIGLDHFARPEDELVRAQQNKTLWRNFQGYTTHKDCDILAFGVSSISQTADVYMQNDKSLKRYEDRIARDGFAVERGVKLSRDDQIRRDAITRVMCDLELDFAAFGREWDIVFSDYFAEPLADLRPLADDGLVEIEAERIRVTPRGRLFLRNIGMCFDRYLKEAASQQPRYSRTA
ncbi:oxygen-independent coproporphyrinogen III oxidase [Thiobacillus sedimenti]|uniref:Coproporphyrinogen-III oxidase n=1 Tax=Thiobacillus sedimenti TaxID=3110231 RepID=A0ABZ1CL61_9PROT|nr:oxygen-independent coproporphyrinogen III oxidase [Thiobacillus sp. SCUT-2]WRS39949.1 oxygen-independent coproporphyrinogen III oxidase [Thiobacillus sp. SCUT-2]